MTRLSRQSQNFWIRLAAVISLVIAIPTGAHAGDPASAPAIGCGDANKQAGLELLGLGGSTVQSETDTGIDGELPIRLNMDLPAAPGCYVLFLNGRAIDGLDPPLYDASHHTLTFHIVRDPNSPDVWSALLGGPTKLSQTMMVSLGLRSGDHSATIVGANKEGLPVQFVLVSVPRLLFAIAAIAIVLGLVWGSAKRTGIMKDNLIPQIEPRRQTYSLARWQMAFWFTLIFASYVFLWILLDDFNTMTSQALMLMGISSTTALAATAIDAAKDTPDDSVNQGLRLLGIKNYEDVERIQGEIVSGQKQLSAASDPVSATTAAQLNSEILDRQLLLRSYEDAIGPYVSQGWFKDVVTDINGTALHRLQVLCWTALLGVIFVFDVWAKLAMPQFSETLLALLAVSSTGYVGFKYSESQQ
jgi:hypothetical protein